VLQKGALKERERERARRGVSETAKNEEEGKMG
jgi:hypothetical protein